MDPHLLTHARLTPELSLEVFRAALAAMSRPGRVEHLPDDVPSSLPDEMLLPLALADLEVAVAVLDHDPAENRATGDDPEFRWADVLRAATGARLVHDVSVADLVVARRNPTPAEIAALRTGDASTPERGARLVVACTSVSPEGARPDGDEVEVHLTGPGAATGRTVYVDGVQPVVFASLRALNRAFPAGVDTWLVATDGAMVAIPRSAAIDLRTAVLPAVDSMNGVC